MHSKEIKYYSLREEKKRRGLTNNSAKHQSVHKQRMQKRQTAKSRTVQNSYKKNIIKIEERYSS